VPQIADPATDALIMVLVLVFGVSPISQGIAPLF
jgi:hypothetical protein